MRYAFAFAYDSLPQDCKDPFLDICSYFKGWDWDTVEDIVGKVELEMLENRALVTRDRNGVASVNDVISTLACQMSKKVTLTFTNASELKKFLEEKDTQGIKGIWLTQNDDNYDVLHISASRLDSMSNSLRVLHLGSSTKVEGNCFYIFDELVFFKGKIVPLPFHLSQLEQLRYLSYEPPPW